MSCVYNFGSGLTSKTPGTKYNAVNNKIGESQCSWPKSSSAFATPSNVGSCASSDEGGDSDGGSNDGGSNDGGNNDGGKDEHEEG